jgi:Zn-dependent protease
MSWSFRIGRLLGIDVFVHATFPLLLAWVGAAHYLPERSAAAAFAGVTFVLALFAIVVLHELGHALTARRFGIRTRNITLLPIGGVAHLERMPERPAQELLVAVAGPLVNVLLAALLLTLLLATGGSLAPPEGGLVAAGPTLSGLLWVNVSLAAFNLLPAFPMDGGRALRAALALRIDRVRATRIAAGIGQACALAFGLLGLLANPLLVLIAVFVWVGAAAEANAVETRAALADVRVESAMNVDFRVLSPRDSLGDASRALLAGAQVDFPVVDAAEKLVGVLTRADLIRGLSEKGPGGAVGSVMTTQFATAEPGERLAAALARARGLACSSVPVRQGERVIGIVTAENVGELLMLRDAAGRSRRACQPTEWR